MIIIGDPGSGKSTLLKAYGLGVLRRTRNVRASDLSKIGPTGEVPFFVQLRGYARHAATQPLAEYLIDHVLVYDAALRPERARALLVRLVRDGRALICLDGLDEVPLPAAAAVRDAIGYFCQDKSVALPTQRARVIVTCRRQNFLGMADHWVPSFASTVHTLSPLRDNEILQYANSLQKEFGPPRSPQTFLADLRGSGVIDYHRTPLVLAISAGLYLGKVGYEIPRTVYLLYDTMVRELLGRHDFRRDATDRPGRGSLGVEGKLLLLRHFALVVARTGGDRHRSPEPVCRRRYYTRRHRLEAPLVVVGPRPGRVIRTFLRLSHTTIALHPIDRSEAETPR